MGYCPDCGWDGYTEGVSTPCGERYFGLARDDSPRDEYDEDEGRTGAPPDGPFKP